MAQPHPSTADAGAVEVAVRVLYSLGAPPELCSPAAQSGAAAWLVAHSDTASAWSTFPQLLAGSQSAEVRFYCANALYAKVRTDWPALEPPARDAVVQQLWRVLEAAGEVVVLRRLCLALAAATVQTPGALPPFFSNVSRSAAAAASPITLLTCVELLACVAELSDELQLPSKARKVLKADIAALAPCVSGLLRALLCAPESPVSLSKAAAACSAAGASGMRAPIESLPEVLCVVSSLKCAKAWATEGGLAFVGAEFDAHAPLLVAAAEALVMLPPSTGVPSAAAAVLSAAFSLSAGLDLSRKADGLTALSLCFLLRCAPCLIPAAAAFSSGDATTRSAAAAQVLVLSEALSALCREAWVAKDGSSIKGSAAFDGIALGNFSFAAAAADVGAGGVRVGSISGSPIGLGVLITDCALQCIASNCLGAAAAAIDALGPIQSITVAERHPYFARPAFLQLARIIACQCIDKRHAVVSVTTSPSAASAASPPRAATGLSLDPHQGSSSSSVDFDVEQWHEFRATACKDALYDCFSLLRGEFVLALLQLLPLPGEHGGISSPILAAALPSHTWHVPEWARLEAVLFCLHSQSAEGSGELADDLAQSDRPSPSAAASALSDGSLSEAIVALILRITTAQSLPSDLSVQACKWLAGAPCAWLTTLSRDAMVRCAQSGGGGASPASPPTASFSLVSVRDIRESILRFFLHAVASGVDTWASWARAQGRQWRGNDVTDAVALTGLDRNARGGSGGGGARGRPGLGDASGDDVDEDGEGGDDDGGALSNAPPGDVQDGEGGGNLARCAAFAVSRFISGGGIAPDVALPPLLAALETASVAGLHLSARARLLRTCVTLALSLPPNDRGAALHRVLTQPVQRITVVAEAAVRLPPGTLLPLDAETALVADISLLAYLLVVLPATLSEEEEDGGGGWAGGSGWGADVGGHARKTPEHPLLWVGTHVWHLLDPILLRLQDALWHSPREESPSASSRGGGGSRQSWCSSPSHHHSTHALSSSSNSLDVLLRFYVHALRCFPQLVNARLPSVVNTAVALVQSQLLPGALTVLEHALIVLPLTAPASASQGGLPPELAASCSHLLSTLLTTATAAAVLPPIPRGHKPRRMAPCVDQLFAALGELFGVCRVALRTSPAALTSAVTIPAALIGGGGEGRDGNGATVQVSAACACLLLAGFAASSAEPDSVRAGVALVKDLLSCAKAGMGHTQPAAVAAQAALSDTAPALGNAIAQSLTAETGSNTSRYGAELFVELIKHFVSSNAAAANALVAAVADATEAVAARAAARLITAADGAPETHARLSAALAAGTPLESTSSLLCLSPLERRRIIEGAARHLVGVGGGAAPPLQLRKCFMLLTDLSSLCRREGDRESLLEALP